MRPYVVELSADLEAAAACERLAGLPYRLWLDSSAITSRLGRFSFLMADPSFVVRSRGTQVEILDCASGERRRHPGDALSAIDTLLQPFATSPVPGLPPFQCGAAGYIAYDWGETLERLPSPRFDDLGLDDVVFGIYDWVLAWDHAAKRVWLIASGVPEMAPDTRMVRARARADAVVQRLDGVTSLAASTMPSAAADGPASMSSAPSYPVEGGWWDERIQLRSSFPRRDYITAVARVREYVHAGDIFQANLSQRFEAPLTEEPWMLYRRLRSLNAAPFAAFMEAPGAAILSTSPERFIRVDDLRHVETRPIKGTSPRGIGPEHDAALGQALTESAKDRAENLMIVDLMRNDLSRVCTPGTVRVPELFALERYATVHHLVSTVVGDLEPGCTALDLLRAAFPGGSITGAPKVRAMEIIAELEPSRRSVYCGSLGYWSLTGELDTSIAIRTAIVRNGRVYFNAGGGIVADSNPEQEYRETLDKARGIIDALRPPS
jgi:para-aminobenzoate synthetase component 1